MGTFAPVRSFFVAFAWATILFDPFGRVLTAVPLRTFTVVVRFLFLAVRQVSFTRVEVLERVTRSLPDARTT